MTVNEFIAELNRLGCSGDERLRISAMGGMRGGKEISRLSVGFDWDSGSIIIHPEQTLWIKPDKK